MPRIPVRIEPYTSPSRQHRHFKNKRDQVLRALGKAAYINGSHFAIMWVSARGDVEKYASEALQDRLEDWFDKSGLAEEAKQLVISAQGNPRSNPFNGEDNDEDGEDLSDDERGLSLQVPTGSTSQSNSLTNTPVTPSQDVFGGGPRRPQLQRSASTSGSGLRGRKGGLSPLNTSMANDDYQRMRNNGELHPQSAVEGHFMGSLTGLGLAGAADMDSLIPPHSAPLRPAASSKSMSRSPSSNQQHVPQFETRLDNQAARTAFLELRFSQLQQGMCKTVAKAWIKIIEPKKQTRCPYNKGEEGKPTWWPEGVRHKEPDHLMKPERHALLLTILRSPKIQVARLQLATAEVVALIKADRVSLLMDVYRIAREEEKMREAGIDLDSPITVGVSTLVGWSESDQCVTAESNGVMDDEIESSIKKKSIAMKRSSSASSALRSNKRSASAMEGSASPFNMKGGNLDVPDSVTRRSSAGWTMQEGPAHKSIKRPASSHSMASAAATAAMAAAGYSQSQQVGIDQTYGLMTPMTNHTSLLDSSFLQSSNSKSNNDSNSASSLVAGYMSAPQPSHSQLFPDGYHQFQATSTPHQQFTIHTSRDASNLFAFQHQQQQQQQRNESNENTSGNNQSALGLQGIGMHWSQAGFNQDFSSNNQSSNGWWQQQQHTNNTKDMGDASFDTSFASTADSVGPATPPLVASSNFNRSNDASKQSIHAHDFMQQQQTNQTLHQHHQQHQHQQQSQFSIHTQQQQQQQVASNNGHQLNRSPYNLSLGKVPSVNNGSFDTWSYQT